MAARGYEFYLLVLKVSRVSEANRVRDVLFVSMYYEMHVSGHMFSKI